MIRAKAGIDCGSASCKAVLLSDGAVLAQGIRPTGWSPRSTAQELLEDLLAQARLYRDEVQVVATGYGRVGLHFADRAVTEITCHAKGAAFLCPEVRTVIDIGGQDSKVIAVENGRVLAFQMNDKCAAGTGRFVEMSAHHMGLELDEFAALLEAEESCTLSSMCAVFADSEIVSLLAAGKSREAIAGGVMESVAARALALAGRLDCTPPVMLTGGLAAIERLRALLSRQLGCPVLYAPQAQFAGAIGAALMKV